MMTPVEKLSDRFPGFGLYNDISNYEKKLFYNPFLKF